MAGRKKPVQWHEITIEDKGKTFQAYFYVERGIVTVVSCFGQKSTQIGSSPAESIARIMLRELIDEAMPGVLHPKKV